MAGKFWRYVVLTFEMAKLSLLSAMEYRASFIVQIIGMILNDVGLIAVWVIFFGRFQQINGWMAGDVFLLFSVFLVSFGLFAFISAGTIEMSKMIAHGQFDYFLALPKNPLWHVSVVRHELFALSDVFVGIFAFFFLTGPFGIAKTVIYILVVTFSALILYNFAVITQSLAFFVGNYEESAERWIWTLFGIAVYPQTIFTGWLKTLTLTILPAYFVVDIPVSLLKEFDWRLLASLFGFWLLTLLLALFMFKHGLKRYESGNLLDPRV